MDVPGGAGLSGQRHMMPHGHAPGNPGLGSDQTVFADYIVMGNMHKIIDFGAPLHDGAPSGRPVDRGIGADFHIVLNNDIADLRHLQVFAVNGDKTEAVATQHGAALDDHPVAQNGPFPQRYIRMNHAVFPDHGAVADIGVRIDDGAVANRDAITDEYLGHNSGRIRQRQISADNHRRMDPPFKRRRWIAQRQ